MSKTKTSATQDSKPDIQPAGQTQSQPASQLDKHKASQPASWTNTKPASWTNTQSQPASQLDKHKVSQPASWTNTNDYKDCGMVWTVPGFFSYRGLLPTLHRVMVGLVVQRSIVHLPTDGGLWHTLGMTLHLHVQTGRLNAGVRGHLHDRGHCWQN